MLRLNPGWQITDKWQVRDEPDADSYAIVAGGTTCYRPPVGSTGLLIERGVGTRSVESTTVFIEPSGRTFDTASCSPGVTSSHALAPQSFASTAKWPLWLFGGMAALGVLLG